MTHIAPQRRCATCDGTGRVRVTRISNVGGRSISTPGTDTCPACARRTR